MSSPLRHLRLDVASWLKAALSARYPSWQADVFDSPAATLASLARTARIQKLLPKCAMLEIQTSITIFLRDRDKAQLFTAQIQTNPITLQHIGPYLAYCRLATPLIALLVSPEGISDRLSALLRTQGRCDVLVYEKNRTLRLATWNTNRREIDPHTVIPKGNYFQSNLLE